MKKKIRVAVLGATGTVGQYFLRLLWDHPSFEVVAVCASDARIGQSLGEIRPLADGGIPEAFHPLTFSPLSVDALKQEGVEVAFSALPTEIASGIEMKCAEAGIHVFSNASAYRQAVDVPILIPEVNASHIALAGVQLKKHRGFIITNANCTTTGLSLALLPLVKYGIRKLIVASYQAISGAGYPGVPAMDITANLIPHIEGEEAKVRRECVKIFGQMKTEFIQPEDWQVFAHCVRVPTLVGHLLSVHVELEQKVEKTKVESSYANFITPSATRGLPTAPLRPVILTHNILRPQPRLDIYAGEPARAAGMAVVVGKLEVEGSVVRFITLSNNLIRGAAGGSVLNAELALAQGWLP